MPHRRVACVLATALLAGMLQAAPARAATIYEVRVGRILPFPALAESARFFPSTIRVHPGDSLHLTSDSAHVPAFLPAGETPETWIPAHWSGSDKDYSPYQADADDGAGAVKLNVAVALPTDLQCGSEQQPCNVGGSETLTHPGMEQPGTLDFSVTVDAPAGTTLWAIDLLRPTMKLRVDVVDANEAADTQEAIDSAADQTYNADSTKARRLHKRWNKRRKTVARNGVTTWTVFAGIDSPTVTLRGFYPAKLKVIKGDKVRWRFDKLRREFHTVSFPLSFVDTVTDTPFTAFCDPDADGTQPDNPPDTYKPPFCNDPSQLELDVASGTVDKIGDLKYSGGEDIASSGARGGGFAPTKAAYALKFTKVLREGYTYGSMNLPTMTGVVAVRRPKRR